MFLFMVFQKQYRGKTILAGVLFITISVWTWSLKKKGLDIVFLDVGQGDSAIIQFENGKTMLVDAGQRNWNRDYGEQVVIPSARYLGVKRFNWVVMTHPHSDHIGGLVSVLEAVPVDTVWDTFSEYGSWTYNQLLESFKQKGVVYRQPNRGETIFIDEKTSLQILAPDSTMVKNEHNVNNMSIVFRLIHGKVTVLFTGDLEKEGDHLLLSLQSYLDSDVLKVAHHGSITSTTQPLLDMITPELAIISVGRKNKFKHPSPIVIQRLMDANVRIHRTDRDGAIWLHSDGKSIKEFAWR
jgi:competence protein ComEC